MMFIREKITFSAKNEKMGIPSPADQTRFSGKIKPIRQSFERTAVFVIASV
jgi:hypothetical protein